MTSVAVLLDPLLLQGAVEAGPAAARFELRPGLEQLLAAPGAPINPRRLRVPEPAGEGPLRPLLTQDVVLLGRQLGPPLVIGLLDLLGHRPPRRLVTA